MENEINLRSKPEVEEDLSKIYMRPKKNAHPRIGNSYQAKIPDAVEHEEPLQHIQVDSEIVITETGKKEEDITHKKRRLD
jgi:hypothetical protein